MGRVFVLIAALTLWGCAGAMPRPIVDLVGKDPVQANSDLADCENKQPVAFFGLNGDGNFYLSRCMEGKGYKVLARTS
jgi:hypothetical protein